MPEDCDSAGTTQHSINAKITCEQQNSFSVMQRATAQQKGGVKCQTLDSLLKIYQQGHQSCLLSRFEDFILVGVRHGATGCGGLNVMEVLGVSWQAEASTSQALVGVAMILK